MFTIAGCLNEAASGGSATADSRRSASPAAPRRAIGAATGCGRDDFLWGVTVTDPWNLAATVEALARLPRRPMARIVFDAPQAGVDAASYVEPVTAIRRVADVMGEILDSQYVETLDAPGYLARTRAYLDTLGDRVDLWEVGNEVNGEWLGATRDVVAKVTGAYELVKARGKPAALTLFYNQGCGGSSDHEMFTWARANVPAHMKRGLDYVFVSYYENECGGRTPHWASVISRLGEMFPRSKLGIGECGFSGRQPSVATRARYLERYYGMRVRHPRFVGGYFYWNFSADMVPSSAPLWATLRSLMVGRVDLLSCGPP